MKVVLKVNWILVTLLSISTGIFKLLQQKAGIELFEKIGFTPIATTLLGVVQLFGGLMLILPKTRKLGAYIMLPTFIIASVAVFANNMIPFGIVSLLFILMVYFVVIMENKYANETA